MRPISIVVAAVVCAAASGGGQAARAAPPRMSDRAVATATFSALPERATQRAEAEVVKAEVLLDRARFSPGAIDGIDGDNFRKALGAYQKQMSLDPSGKLDRATWDKLNSDTAAPLTPYTITETDAKGPFTKTIPAKFQTQARLKHLGYRDIREMLAEKFHMSVPLLMALNAGSAAFHAGQQITAAAVERPKPTDKAARVVVDKSGRNVEALSADGKLLAFYPASVGSDEKPAPTGQFVIRRIVHHPDYTYEPEYHFKGVTSKTPFTIAPGPNNPVGVVWMDLSYEGYGIHGTPSPETIGKTQSHGCVRLTNWDAENLAAMVDQGVPVSFQDAPGTEAPPHPAPVADTVPAEHDVQPKAQGPSPQPPLQTK